MEVNNAEMTSEMVVNKIKKAFVFLRKKSQEVKSLKSYRLVDIKNTQHYEILSKLQQCGIIIPTYIDKNIDVETIIFDCKECLKKKFPDLYNILISSRQGTNDILSRFYSGPKKSYIKLFELDLAESDSFRDLTPSEALILIDMMRVLNYQSQKTLNIIGVGFTYTFKHCKINVSEDTFKRAIPKIVEKGFFTLKDFKKGRMNVYLPSEKWKEYKSQKNSDIEEIKILRSK